MIYLFIIKLVIYF